MSRIKIMCTSTGCIENAPERYRNLGIDIVRLSVLFEGKEYTEGLDLDPDEFYAKLEKLEDPKNNLPKTSMPSSAEISKHYEKAIADGYDEVIFYTLSTGLSGTYDVACGVAKNYADKIKIHVVDTKNNSFVEGFLAVRAQQMVNEGKSSEQILKESAWTIKHQRFIAVDGKLDYLIYNGRLKGGKAFLGQLLNICPILHFTEDGSLVALENVRTQKKALARMCEIVNEAVGDRSPEDYILFHIYTGRSLLNTLLPIEEKLGIKTNHEEVIMSPISGSHNGPYLAGYGLVFLRRDDEPLED